MGAVHLPQTSNLACDRKWERFTSILPPAFLYLYTGQSPTDLQSGTLDQVYYQTTVNPPHINVTNTSLYIADDWRISTALTASLGLRWEYNPAPGASGFGLLAMRGNPDVPSSITLAPAGTSLYRTRYDDFAPRLGFAYAVRGGDNFGTVLRAGAGIFFDTGQTAAAAQAAQVNYPYGQTAFLQNVPYSSLNVSQIQGAPVGLPQYDIFLTDPNLAAPLTYSWSLTLDQKLGERTSVSTSYVGNTAHHLLKDNAYQGLSPALTPAYGYLYVYNNGENSSYNALQTQARIRGTERLNVLASYTFAHALDNGSSEFESVAGYQKNYRANSDNDIRHIFSSAIHYSPQGFANTWLVKGLTQGWSFDTIALVQSAAPLSVYSYSNTIVNPNLYNTYADIVPGVPTVISNPAAPGGKQLNPAAFAVAPGTRDGTSARNGYRLFGLTQWDLAISRSWPLWEKAQMMFRVDAFNILNKPNFSDVDTGLGDATFGQALTSYAGIYGSSNADYGTLNQVFSNGGPRSLELSLKLRF